MILVISIVLGSFAMKETEVKSSYTIDSPSERCYDDCIGIEPLVYESVIVKEIRQQKVDTIEKSKATENARKVELARVEAIRVSAILTENKRLANIEAKKKRSVEIEKKRLAKLDKQREINRLAKLEKKKQPMLASRGTGYQSNYQTTFYTSSCKGCSGQSASGEWVNKGVTYQGYRIVAAPPSIKFYTKLKITFSDGSNMNAIVLDRGSDIQQGRLDILVASKDEAYRLGRQQVKVEILN